MKSLIFIQILIFLILNCIEVAVPAQENDWRNSKLIIYLPFENNLKDVSNHLNDGRASLQSYSTDRFGKQNGAYSFENGLHSRIYIPNYPNPYEYDFSICIWAFTKSRSRQSLVSKRYDHDEVIVWPFVIELMSNGKISFYLRKDIHDEHIIFINSEVRYPLNEWMFIAAVREKGVFSLYLNGKRVGALKDPYFENQILANMQNLILGSSSNSELVLNGKIDDFRLYHKALKSSEIKMLFNENKY